MEEGDSSRGSPSPPARPLQGGPGGGQPGPCKSEPVPLAHARQARSSLCSACSREPFVHPSRTVCAHTRSHICTPNTAPRTHITHTPSCTHVITYTCTLACKRHHGNTPHHVHTHARAHCHVCILQVVALGGGPDTPLSREEDPPRTAGHCRTTPHAHSSCYQHPIQKTVLIRKSANGSLQLLIASLIWDFFQGGTE